MTAKNYSCPKCGAGRSEMLLLLWIVVLPFVTPFFLLMALRNALGLNPYHVTLQYWPMWQNVLWVAALVVLYVGYIYLYVDFFRHKGERCAIDGMVIAGSWLLAWYGATIWAGQCC